MKKYQIAYCTDSYTSPATATLYNTREEAERAIKEWKDCEEHEEGELDDLDVVEMNLPDEE